MVLLIMHWRWNVTHLLLPPIMIKAISHSDIIMAGDCWWKSRTDALPC